MTAGLGQLSRREKALLAGLLLLLVVVRALVPPEQTEPDDESRPPSLSVHSNQGDGARALALWVAELGYRPGTIEYRPFGIDPETEVLFLLTPVLEISEANVAQIQSWVEDGGTLVLVVAEPNALFSWLGIDVEPRATRLDEAIPRQPVFQRPALREIEPNADATLVLRRPEWVPLIGAPPPNDEVIAVTAQFGEGRVYVLTAADALTNDGLRRADNWLLPLHVLADVPPGSIVAFDEYHHGLTEHGTLGSRLLREPWGWAILYTAALLFAFVTLRGRRFGRAIPPPGPGTRRSRGEYVTTLAGLLRQGGDRDWLCQQYVAQVKRALGARYRVRGDLPAREFVADLAVRRPEAVELAKPLERLEQRQAPDEATVVMLMRDVDRVRARLVAS